MEYRKLGRSSLEVPVISFGAGPISGLMVGDDSTQQRDTISHAVECGIDYFDTAATYGGGQSEQSLGRALSALRLQDRVRIATKVRLMPEHLHDIGRAVRESFEASCERLGVEHVALLQLHNSITTEREDLPTSLSVTDVLGQDGVVAAFEQLQREGRVHEIGFTGLGDTQSLTTVVKNGPFVSAQIPLNILLPFADVDTSAGSVDVDYLALARLCQEHRVGVIGIRLMAGGALAGHKPAAHTYRTKFFPLDLFHRDRNRAASLAQLLPDDLSAVAASIRYVTGTLKAATALIGFSSPEQIDEALNAHQSGGLDDSLMKKVHNLDDSGIEDIASTESSS